MLLFYINTNRIHRIEEYMALNWIEINTILDELPLKGALIQNIRQSSFKHLLLELYSSEQGRFELLLAFNEDALRLHQAFIHEKSMEKPPRFCEYLRANLKGARITKVEQLGKERIVCFWVNFQGEQNRLYLRLWTGRANLIYTNEEGSILDVLFRRPRQKECPQELYRPETNLRQLNSEEEAKMNAMTVRFIPVNGSHNEGISDYYADLESTKSLKRIKLELTNELEKKISQQRVKVKNLESASPVAENQSDESRDLHYGNLLLNYISQNSNQTHEAGLSSLLVLDYENKNKEVKIALNPHLDLKQNIQHYFRKARRNKRSERFNSEELLSRKELLYSLEKRLERVEESEDLEYLESLVKLQRSFSKDKKQIGLTFDSHDFVLLVGRSASESDALLRHSVKGNDLWLHVRDATGGFVFIRTKRNKNVPLPVLLDAGQLALHFSSLRREKKARISYTAVKNVSRQKDAGPGKVSFSFEKTLDISYDDRSLQPLLEQNKDLGR